MKTISRIWLSVLAIFISATILSACGEKSPPAPSFNTLEDYRNIARENALYNANVYRAENPRLEGTQIVTHGDSTQDANCPQGDGWASVSFMSVTGSGKDKQVEKYKAKCSTVSASIGCFLEDDFSKKKNYAAQENQCDRNLPVPIPRIAK